MTDGHRGNSVELPDVSGVYFLPETLKKLGEPIFARFSGRLAPGDQALILAAVNDVPWGEAQVTPAAVQEIICREVLDRVLGRLVRELGLSPDEVRRDLDRARAQLDGLAGGVKPRTEPHLPTKRLYWPPKRIYYVVSVLQRCATLAQVRDAIECSCLALGMIRNDVDVYKGRALKTLSANTCFRRLKPESRRGLLRELHLFFLHVEPGLRAAACALLEAYSRRGSIDGGARIVAAHEERKLRRNVYDSGLLEAKRVWTTQLPEVLDNSGMRPIDVVEELSAKLRREGLPPDQITERVRARWEALWIDCKVPNHLSPTTTWKSILSKAARPPIWVLEGEWARLLGGRGVIVEDTWRCLVATSRHAEAAHAAWIGGLEHTLVATQHAPTSLKAAIVDFNLSVDELLMRSAEGRVSR